MDTKFYSSSYKTRIKNMVFITLVPIIIVMLIFNYFSLQDVRDKFLTSHRQSVYLYASNIEKHMSGVDNFLRSLALSDHNFLDLMAPTTPLKAHLASHEIISQLTNAINAYDMIGAFFVYSTINNIYRDIFADEYNYEQQKEIRRILKNTANKKEIYYNKNWNVVNMAGENYLMKVLGKEGTYVIAMLDFNKVISTDPIDTTVKIVYSDLDGNALTAKNFIYDNNIDLTGNFPEGYSTTKNYMVVGREIQGADINILFILSQPGLFTYFEGVQLWLLICTAIAILILPAAFILLRKLLIVPLNKLVDSIYNDSELTDTVEEFNQVNKKFSSMKTQINELKIIAYENEIEKQKAELQYLHLQLRPHFFLNCLKSLYGMAQCKKTEQIQQMILSISNHLRYNFKDNLELVPLKDEIEHVKNYIQIQQMASRFSPICIFNVDEKLMDFLVPPLLIQTFVENSFKYAMAPDKQLKINFKIIILKNDEGDYVDITIEDNGDGFSESVLSELNLGKNDLYKERNIGVTNVRHRLKLLYGDKAILAFFNSNEGAVTDILLPSATKNHQLQ